MTNMPIQGMIRIIKTDSETGKRLPGAVFTVTRISGLPSHNGGERRRGRRRDYLRRGRYGCYAAAHLG